jgi:hypothetical protein
MRVDFVGETEFVLPKWSGAPSAAVELTSKSQPPLILAQAGIQVLRKMMDHATTSSCRKRTCASLTN